MHKSHRRLDGVTMLALLATLVVARAAPACGAWFPNRILNVGEREFLALPRADFYLELRRIVPVKAAPANQSPSLPKFDGGDPSAAELADLTAALKERGDADAAAGAITGQYKALREALNGRRTAAFSWRAAPRTPSRAFSVPAGLPGEFEDYIRGAISYHAGNLPDAREHWQRLLERPAAERRYRSVWAAFMLGKTWLDDDPARASACFQQARELAAAVLSDTMALAKASIGWEARAEFRRKDYARALELYAAQFESDDQSAYLSIQSVARALCAEEPAVIERTATNPLARRIVTAYVASRGDGAEAGSLRQAWLAALEHIEIPVLEGAEQLAWLAYRQGLVDVAERWLARAPADAPVALWVKAKLLLRAGKIEPAAELLSRVSRLFPAEETWCSIPVYQDGLPECRTPGERALAEFGALKLARRQFSEAFDALFRAGYWIDAAYVAERVLSIDELKQHVDRNWPETPPADWDPAPVSDWKASGPQQGYNLRYMLARRLARAERWQEARAYYPPKLLPLADNYVASIATSTETRQLAEVRAAALWKAAVIARTTGMELLGTEVEPDWALYGGNLDLSYDAAMRYDDSVAPPMRPSPDEIARVRAHAPIPDKRFHYRYRAANLTLEAARLMPKNSDTAARWLCITGRSIMGRDPKEADRLYKALVRDHGATELGWEADRLRWFPRIDAAGNLAPPPTPEKK